MLADNVMPAQKVIQNKVQHYIDEQVVVFSREVMKEYSNIFRKVGLRSEVIYIYGGGANNVKKTLYPMVIETSTLSEGNCLPVIYLDSTYSRDLNRTGLYEVAVLGAQAVGL
jgi:plasmid segregation protein ParM